MSKEQHSSPSSPLHDGLTDGTLPTSQPDTSRNNVSFRRWGIYEIADLRSMYHEFQYGAHVFRDLHSVAPTSFILYALACTWTSIAPAISLWMLSSILRIADSVIATRYITEGNLQTIQVLAVTWLFSTLLSSLVDRVKENTGLLLREHLRAYFLPQLAQASLRFNSTQMQEISYIRAFPQSYEFDEVAPGWDVVQVISSKIQNVLAVVLEGLILIHAISRKTNKVETVFLTGLCLMHPVLARLLPLNGVGGAGYTFWTKNFYFHRLRALYAIIFTDKYRDDICKDGMRDYLRREYERTSRELGVVQSNAFHLSWSLRRAWYWDFLNNVVMESPLALYSLTLPWTMTTSSLATMVLLQHATLSLQRSFNMFSTLKSHSLRAICGRARELYETVELAPVRETEKMESVGRIVYRPESNPRGMKLSFRNVSLRYPTQKTSDPPALHDISFDIPSGSLTIIVGVNGSGKSSLLKLLPSLVTPNSGQCLIDDVPISSYHTDTLLPSMAILSQSPETYPLSVRENIQMGLPSGGRNMHKKDVDAAARMGEGYEVLQRVGYNTVLRPLPIPGVSSAGCGNGDVSPGAMEEFERNTGARREMVVSPGERQRLAASRTFMRLNNSTIRLLVVDEPTSALDPIAERNLLTRFREGREGRTTIFVTHRFGHLVEYADQILVMDGGRLVERGTHEELIADAASQYSRLYRAQCKEEEEGDVQLGVDDVKKEERT